MIERYGVTIFYTAPTAIRACMKWGPSTRASTTCRRCACSGTVGEPINPKAWLWYHDGGRPRALPDRRHLVADRDRADHDRAAAGADGDQARLGDPAAARRASAAVVQRGRRGASTAGRACSSSRGRGRGCCARSTATTSASSRPTSRASARAPTWSATRARRDEDGYFWIIGRIDDVINVSGHRLSTAEVESAIVAHAKVAEAAVVGRGRRAHRPGDRRVRDARRRAARATTRSRPRSASTWRADRQARAAEADHLGRRSAEDPLGQDHAPAAAGHRRGPRAGRRDDAARRRG